MLDFVEQKAVKMSGGVPVVGAKEPELEVGIGCVWQPEGVDVSLCCGEIARFCIGGDGEGIPGAVFGALGELELGRMDDVGLGVFAVEEGGVREDVLD